MHNACIRSWVKTAFGSASNGLTVATMGYMR